MTGKARRRKRSAAARLRPFWFLMLLVALGATAGGYYAATWPGFFVHRITVQGNHVVSTREIVDRAGIAVQQNLWLQNMGAAALRVEEIPYVAQAWIDRSLPASARIVVTERKPFAFLRYGRGGVIVDRALRVLQYARQPGTLPVLQLREGSAPLPGTFVTASDAERLRDDEQVLAQAHVVAAELHYDRYGDLVVLMRNGIRLLLGDDGEIASTSALVGPILSQLGAQGKKIAAVDLRAPRTPVVVYRREHATSR